MDKIYCNAKNPLFPSISQTHYTWPDFLLDGTMWNRYEVSENPFELPQPVSFCILDFHHFGTEEISVCLYVVTGHVS
jgi:hypothetical protein